MRITAAPAFSRRAWQGSTPRWRPTACVGNATRPNSTACAGSCCWRATAWPRRVRRWRASTGLELGREKGALAWELRAAMSIVRLRQRQGQEYAEELAKARACLRSIYVWFTEGFAYPDLEEAAVLIGPDSVQVAAFSAGQPR